MAEEVLGPRPSLGAAPYATDARFRQEASGMPTVRGFGPGTITVCHGPNEYAPVEDVVAAAKTNVLAGTGTCGGVDRALGHFG